jgi:hypothetical protein
VFQCTYDSLFHQVITLRDPTTGVTCGRGVVVECNRLLVGFNWDSGCSDGRQERVFGTADHAEGGYGRKEPAIDCKPTVHLPELVLP